MKEKIIRAKQDQEACLELLTNFAPLIKKTTRQYVRDFERHPDALQEGYCTLLKCIHSYDPDSGVPFPGYVKIAIRNNLLHFANRQKFEASLNNTVDSDEDMTFLEMLPADVDIEGDHIHALERIRLREALEQLPEKQRNLVLDVYFRHKTMRSLSVELNCHYNTVVKMKNKAIASLRENLGDLL